MLPAVIAAAAVLLLPALVLAPNRLAAGQPLPGSGALGAAAYAIAGLCLLAGGLPLLARTRLTALAALAAAGTALVLLAGTVGAGAGALLLGRPPAARVSLGSGVWVAAGGALVLLLEAGRRTRLPGVGGLALAALALLGVAAAWTGAFASLSLAVEYRARSGELWDALIRHVALASGGLALALALALPLGVVRFRGGRAGATVDAVLAGLQVVPALALFGALVAGLAALLAWLPGLRGLGLAAIGPTPALVGIAAYLLLPLVRSLADGLAAPDAAVLDAARALGLTPARTLVRVRLPLGAPILVGGLRVAAVQSIGLATLGGLIGAGGFGSVVFAGMSQFAPDLILLGAVPIVILSLVADRLLRLAADAATRLA